MKIKVGKRWYEPRRGRPIMIVLGEQDKDGLLPMFEEGAEYDRYACFAKNDPLFPDEESKLRWMKEQ
jgi:hypothetical protein